MLLLFGTSGLIQTGIAGTRHTNRADCGLVDDEDDVTRLRAATRSKLFAFGRAPDERQNVGRRTGIGREPGGVIAKAGAAQIAARSASPSGERIDLAQRAR